jgi:hypothetical protein
VNAQTDHSPLIAFRAALVCDKDGTVRQLDNYGIAGIRGDHVERIPLLPSHEGYYDRYRFTSFIATPHHELIASTLGFYREWALELSK